jgi:hypothetical protein
MRRVWSLSSGSYSDYQVLALFTTKKLAEAALVAHQAEEEYPEARVEEFTLYDEVPERATVYLIVSVLWDDGRETASQLWGDSKPGVLTSTTKLPWNHWYRGTPRVKSSFVRAPVYKNQGGRLEAWGTDEQAVKQAFSDRKARIVAEREGLV